MGPSIRSVARVLPDHYADQEALIAGFRTMWAKQFFNVERLEELHRAVGVSGRHLALPVSEYEKLTTFEQRNAAWTREAVNLGEKAVRAALESAQLEPKDIDQIFFVTVTGLATPSIDARLVNRLGFRTDIKRTPIFGLGCVAGAAGLARASDALRGFPKGRSILLSVELCSLTLQRDDLSIANLIASGLFGDGAAAVVLEGEQHETKGPRVVATRSVFYPGTEQIMGWDFVNSGFKVVLSAKVPSLVREHLGQNVDEFLASEGLGRKDIAHWVAHTGGPKVLDAFAAALELPAHALERSRRSLQQVGNLSSASVLHVLGDLFEEDAAKPGERGLVLAMGPGFCGELVLLQW